VRHAALTALAHVNARKAAGGREHGPGGHP
jgi:hypothetical protein